MYRKSPINIVNAIFLSLFFLGPVLVWFVDFNWVNLSLFLLNFFWFGLSSSLFYHRSVSHGAVKLALPLEVLFHFGGVISLSGSAVNWTATHRFHHSVSDKDEDPHTPVHGRWWAYVSWAAHINPIMRDELKDKYCQDLLMNKLCAYFDRPYMSLFPMLIYVGLVYYLFGLGGVVWGFLLAGFVSHNFHWMLIASFCHHSTFGYRRFETKDESRNIPALSLITFGESLHNNHHQYPGAINLSSKFGEFDLTYYCAIVLSKLGLAKDLVKVKYSKDVAK